jgi:uncharacterized membrane protein YraQ (UPF0718 family)
MSAPQPFPFPEWKAHVMTTVESVAGAPAGSRRHLLVGLAGVTILAVIFVLGLWWAKWAPYARKGSHLSTTHTWPGSSMFAESGQPGAAPTLSGAWRFATTYMLEVWRGFAVALVAAAAFDALVPRAWLLGLMNRRTRVGQAVAGGTASLPSLMCTCCASPLTVGLRQRGVGTAASLAYWLGNPLLNPAVLVFLFLVAPWQFGVVRIIAGVSVVAGGSVLVARLFRSWEPAMPGQPEAALTSGTPSPQPPDPASLGQFPLRFARSLLRLAVILIPVYAAAVLVLGYVSGWLSDFAGLDARLGLVAVLVCAVIGTLLVIPTGGEIPVILALSAAGVSAGTAGALLITLPALSVPSMLMVGRALSWRVTAAAAGLVVLAGLVAAVMLWLLL